MSLFLLLVIKIRHFRLSNVDLLKLGREYIQCQLDGRRSASVKGAEVAIGRLLLRGGGFGLLNARKQN